jgi:hypothetical protein
VTPSETPGSRGIASADEGLDRPTRRATVRQDVAPSRRARRPPGADGAKAAPRARALRRYQALDRSVACGQAESGLTMRPDARGRDRCGHYRSLVAPSGPDRARPRRRKSAASPLSRSCPGRGNSAKPQAGNDARRTMVGPDAGGRNSCGTKAPSSPPKADRARPPRTLCHLPQATMPFSGDTKDCWRGRTLRERRRHQSPSPLRGRGVRPPGGVCAPRHALGKRC